MVLWVRVLEKEKETKGDALKVKNDFQNTKPKRKREGKLESQDCIRLLTKHQNLLVL